MSVGRFPGLVNFNRKWNRAMNAYTNLPIQSGQECTGFRLSRLSLVVTGLSVAIIVSGILIRAKPAAFLGYNELDLKGVAVIFSDLINLLTTIL